MTEINNYGVKTYQPTIKKEKQKPKGSFASLTIGTLAQAGVAMPSAYFLKKLQKVNHNTTKEQADLLNKIADDILISSKLVDKGVTIKNIESSINLAEIPYNLKFFISEVSRGNNSFFVPADLKGKNKNFTINANTILANREKMSLALFHELGHAHNFNTTKIQRYLMKNKISLPLFSNIVGGFLIMFNAYTKNSKPTNGDLSTKDKLKNTIRNISPALAGLACVPMLVEEGTASLKAEKWIKDKIPKELFDKVKKSNRNGFITYGLTTISLILGTYITKKIKDNKNK